MGMMDIFFVGLVSESVLKKFGGDGPEDSIPYFVSYVLFVCVLIRGREGGERKRVREREGGRERERGER